KSNYSSVNVPLCRPFESRSKEQTRAQLHEARSSRACEPAEGGAVQRRREPGEVGVVEEIERIGPQLEPQLFGDREVLSQRKIDIQQARASHGAIAYIAGANGRARSRADRDQSERRTVQILQRLSAV